MLADVAFQAPHPRIDEFIQRPEIQHWVQAFVAQMLVAQLVTVLAYWMASKTVAQKDKSTLLNAFLLWLIYIVFGFVLVFGTGILVPIVAALIKQDHDNTRAKLIFGGIALTAILLVFLIPMKLYVIGFFRAVCLLILTFFISMLGMVPVDLLIYKLLIHEADLAAVRTLTQPGPDQKKFLLRLGGQNAPDEIDRLLDDALDPIGPKPPLDQREAQVRELQKKLAARQVAVPLGDPAARAAFQEKLTRYLQFRDQVLAERKAQPATSGH